MDADSCMVINVEQEFNITFYPNQKIIPTKTAHFEIKMIKLAKNSLDIEKVWYSKKYEILNFIINYYGKL